MVVQGSYLQTSCLVPPKFPALNDTPECTCLSIAAVWPLPLCNQHNPGIVQVSMAHPRREVAGSTSTAGVGPNLLISGMQVVPKHEEGDDTAGDRARVCAVLVKPTARLHSRTPTCCCVRVLTTDHCSPGDDCSRALTTTQADVESAGESSLVRLVPQFRTSVRMSRW